MNPNTVEHPYIHINGNTGYSRQGDTVSLFADRIDNVNNVDGSSDTLALQLWACQAPYHGGTLAGWKLAEFQLGPLQANHYLASVKSDVQASFPESGDYAIALVVAEWDGEGFNRVHDFYNYPNRDVFLHPRLEGSVGYHCVDETRVIVDVGRIYNPRDPDNSSGTLSLELWALPEPYMGGAFTGQALAAVTLGSLVGGESWQDCVYDLEMTQPPAGTYTVALMLREWVGNGYVTRDHSNFQYPVTFPISSRAPEASETMMVDAAKGQVASLGQSAGQASGATVVEDVAGAEHEAELSQPEDTKQPSEPTAVDTAPDQAASSGQATEQATETTVVGIVAAAEPQAKKSQPEDAKPASEQMAVDTAPDQAASSGQATGQASEATVAGDVAGAEVEARPSEPNYMQKASAVWDRAKILAHGVSDALKVFGRRLAELFEELKQRFRI